MVWNESGLNVVEYDFGGYEVFNTTPYQGTVAAWAGWNQRAMRPGDEAPGLYSPGISPGEELVLVYDAELEGSVYVGVARLDSLPVRENFLYSGRVPARFRQEPAEGLFVAQIPLDSMTTERPLTVIVSDQPDFTARLLIGFNRTS